MDSDTIPVLRPDEQVRWHLHGLNTGTVFAMTHWGVSHVPRCVSYGIGHVATWLAFHTMKQSTAALIDNLRIVQPALSEPELAALALRTYRSYARETIDFIRALSMTRSQLASMLSPVNTFDREPDGKGLLLVTGHIGNIELGAVMLSQVHRYPLSVIVLSEENRRVNQRRLKMRASLGIDSIEVRQEVETPLRIRRLLAENRAVAIISDRPLGRDRVDVQFFGRRTAFLRTPALLGYLTGAPLVPSFILRQSDGRYAGLGLDPIHVARTGDRDANVQAAMQSFATALEKIVREYHHLWYHFYPYWADSQSPAEAAARTAG